MLRDLATHSPQLERVTANYVVDANPDMDDGIAVGCWPRMTSMHLARESCPGGDIFIPHTLLLTIAGACPNLQQLSAFIQCNSASPTVVKVLQACPKLQSLVLKPQKRTQESVQDFNATF